MRNRFIGSIIGLAAGAGLALAQDPPAKTGSEADAGVYSRMYPDLSAIANGSPEKPVKAIELAPMPAEKATIGAIRIVEFPAKPAAVRPIMPTSNVVPVDSQTVAPVQAAPVVMAPTCSTCVDHFTKAKDMHGWIDAEYLLWRITNGPAPLLATTGTPANLGIPGLGGVPLGNREFDYGQISGVRIVSGGWLNGAQTIGMDGEMLYLSRVRDGFTFASDAGGNPVLARPFIDPNIPGENVLLLAFPGVLSGAIRSESASYLEGWDSNLVFRLIGNCNVTIDTLIGFRYLDLREDLKVTSNSSLLNQNAALSFNTLAVAAPAEITTYDQFTATSQFYGGQLGARGEWCCDRWVLKSSAKVGLGVMQEIVRTAGATTLFSALPAPMTTQGGFLAVASNSFTDVRNQFAVVPEVGVKLGFKVTSRLMATAGYNVLYASSVARPGDQVDPNINPVFVPQSPNFGGPVAAVRPTLGVRPSTDFWAYGATFGLSYEF